MRGTKNKNPIIIKLMKKFKLEISAQSRSIFPEAYMNDEIKIENTSLSEFLNLVFKNIAKRDNDFWIFVKKYFTWRYLSNYNLPFKSRKDIEHHYDVGGKKEKNYDIFLDKKHRQYSLLLERCK